jgi:16S rRNA (uracil1498-N3)-methyltransferase
MRLHRFYTQEKLGENFHLKDEGLIHQIKYVFRGQVGDSFIFFGDGYEHIYTLLEISKKELTFKEVKKEESRLRGETPSVALALIKRDSFELALKVMSEAGVATIIPFIADRSEKRILGSLERLQKILIESTEQSGWGDIPCLKEVCTYEEVLKNYPCVIFHTDGGGERKLSSEKVFCVGPEGGFTEREISLAQEKGAHFLHLPTGVLRAETAALTAVLLAKI